MSRALVVLAERGVRAETEAKVRLKAARRNFVQEAEPERKNEAGLDLIRASSGRIRLPKIQFSELPRGVWRHLLQRVDERRISVGDLPTLQAWVRTGPLAPEGDCHKNFGSLLLCGSGKLSKTVL